VIHPDTELRFISREIGYGVVATRLIPAGTITWVLDKLDKVFSPGEFNAFEAHYQAILDTYTFRDGKGNYVLCWDNGRFVNHSFRSNCLTTAYDFEIAIRDIYPGEQLTDDYGYLNISKPFKPLDEGTKRKVVYPDDLLKYSGIWDKKLMQVFPKIPIVPQALEPFLSTQQREEISAISRGNQPMKSILENYFDQGQRMLNFHNGTIRA
jgi:hypothetical protein